MLWVVFTLFFPHTLIPPHSICQANDTTNKVNEKEKRSEYMLIHCTELASTEAAKNKKRNARDVPGRRPVLADCSNHDNDSENSHPLRTPPPSQACTSAAEDNSDSISDTSERERYVKHEP